MAGGMILIGVLGLLLPVTSAMVLHGFTQIIANGSRAILLRRKIKYQVLPFYLLGSLTSLALFSSLSFIPSKSLVLISVGLFPFIALFMPKSLSLNLLKHPHSYACGLIVTAAQLLAGASGPLLDVFYLNSSFKRHEIIATKALTQTVGHIIKLFYYGHILYLTADEGPAFAPSLLPLVAIAAVFGTRLGKSVLDRLSEIQFHKFSRIVIKLIGGFYLVKGITLAL